MSRKSEQQLTLEEQHRLWMGRQRKARTHQQQVTIQKIITGIEAKLWRDPAAVVAKTAKLRADKAVEPVKEPEKTALEVVLEEERVRRETPEPSIVFEQARRAEVRTQIKKEQEALENTPITAPQSDVQEAGDGVTPPKRPAFTLPDMFKTVSRSFDSDEHDGSVRMSNALRSGYNREPEHHEPPGEWENVSDGMTTIRRRVRKE